MILGHEITGEIIEVGKDVEYMKVGDVCSVPFNIACGRCTMCKSGHTGICLNVNPARPGEAPRAENPVRLTRSAGGVEMRRSVSNPRPPAKRRTCLMMWSQPLFCEASESVG